MRILVTGGSGFIGHHFIEHLIANTDWEITVLDSLTYAGDLERLRHVRDKLRFVYHNLEAPITEAKADRLGEFDFIVNFAAQSHVENSLKDPVLFATSNVIGTVNLLEFARLYQKDLKRFIQISTDEVYGPAPNGVFYEEWDRIKPSNPYSASKAGADAFAIAYATSYGMPIIITRTMNNFGERQHPEKFIPMCIKKILNGEAVTIHGNANKIGSRCWLHARNHADGVLHLLHNNPDKGEIFHIAGDEYTNLEIAQIIADTLDKPLHYELVDFHSTRPGHDLRYALDGTRMYKGGWIAPVPFKESLEKMVRWTAEHKEWLV